MNNKRIILHIDMNSYFASVEQQANPFLRGKAVGVCAYMSPGGCIIASSAEAKAKGIKTGCTVRDAKQLDPDVVLVENEPAKYRSTTERIFSILAEYTDRLEPYSIDESFLDLTGWTSDFGAARDLGILIQRRIKDEVGEWLNCSVGISWTKFLAKFAGDIAPKKGMVVIGENLSCPPLLKGVSGGCFEWMSLDGALRDRPLTDAWGINSAMEARLNALGIKTLLDLKLYDKDKIRRVFGRYGYYLWANVNGIEITKVENGTPPPKSVGHSYCIPKKTKDKEYLSLVLYKLCEKTGRRLRSLELEANVINIFFAYTYGGGTGKSFKTSERMFTTEEIYRYAGGFLERTQILLPVRMIAVSVTRLSSVSSQMGLFYDNLKMKDLSRAMDRINDKYGEYTVCRGLMFGTENVARDRIGFRKTLPAPGVSVSG